jgi:hypothetical protein
MKKLILLAAIVLSAAASFGRDIDNRKVQLAFDRVFAGAANVQWYETDNNYMARFTLRASKVTAHFDKDGTLIATSRIITDAELPLEVVSTLIRKFRDQKIHSIMEYVVDGNTYYAITLESATQWTVLRTNSIGEAIVMKKLQKA